jgi:hypothetical protein
MLEKTEGAIKIVQSRDTGNIVHKRHRTKIKIWASETHQKPGLNPGAREGQVVSCYIITHMKDWRKTGTRQKWHENRIWKTGYYEDTYT